ncbi:MULTISPECIES: ubiquitin-like domain-containing protein [unclassified Oerskovia]|uniref:aggregation-promoting factor C-terminal-like domain-containing protein n=1 Tax=unclassified Oerskovia TaxID=2619021 RepID=UPI0009EC4B8D|nr:MULTISPECIES: ubiquitin-like domain-containing protein [unclassified Oerskovia]
MRRSSLTGRWRLVAQAAILATVVGTTGVFALAHKSVVLDVDGEVRTVSAYGSTVGDLLDFQDVAIKDSDLVEPAADERATDGGTIVVRTSREISLELDGKPQTFVTTARTVGELLTALGPRAEGAMTSASRSQSLGREQIRVSTLKTVHVAVDGAIVTATTSEASVEGVLEHAGITLSVGDAASVPLGAAAVDGMLVLVTRAASGAATVTETLPFETEEVKDPYLPQGQRKVRTSGKVGEAVTTYAIQTVGGTEVSRTVVDRTVTREPRTEVVVVGSLDPSTIKVDPGSSKAIAKSLAAQRGWGDDQFACLDLLWMKESRWNATAENRSSGAYGIPQALPGSKMASAGADWRTNPATQITWGLGYIEGRYGTPCGAWSHSQAKGWY